MEINGRYVFLELERADVQRWNTLPRGGWKREGPDSLLQLMGKLEIPDVLLVPLEVFVALDQGKPVERWYLMHGPAERKVEVREHQDGTVFLKVTNHVYTNDGGMKIDNSLGDKLLLALPRMAR